MKIVFWGSSSVLAWPQLSTAKHKVYLFFSQKCLLLFKGRRKVKEERSVALVVVLPLSLVQNIKVKQHQDL